MHTYLLKRIVFILIYTFLFSKNDLSAQSNEDCMMCHEDPDLTTQRQGETKSLYVRSKVLNKSVHGNIKCISCHVDAAVEEFPHPEILKPVDCGICHVETRKQFNTGVHGQALKLNKKNAPDCKECHGSHNIVSSIYPNSITYKMNIPLLCGKCHREGAPILRGYNVQEQNAHENFSQNIHGKGLFNKGLVVTATCNDCHGNHLILPHTSPNSTICIKNIAGTCMKCHTKVEEIHTKIIKKNLWKEKPGSIPACVDCHHPHKSIQGILEVESDRVCLKCHQKNDIYKIVNGKKVSLKVERADFMNSVHKNIPCSKCHSDVSAKLNRPCETAKKVECYNCHAEVSNLYFQSGHGQAYMNKDKNAPFCSDCHGAHEVKSRYDDTSPTYRSSIPGLCGKCHRKDGKAVENSNLMEIDAYFDYSSSVHGKGIGEKGLLASAVCSDCHSTHFILKESDERSSVHPNNIPLTCAKCHKSIYDEYNKSEHSFHLSKEREFPTCVTCHRSHVISEIDQDKFMTEVTLQCGSCHKKLSETYLETYHGKAYQLGYLKTARCSDCHGAHNILNIKNLNSSVGKNNIVSTCQKCHPKANLEFTNYLTHATHNDKENYPVLYYTYWAMTSLLIGVFGFFGVHTLLWLPQSIRERKKKRHTKIDGSANYIRRFSKSQRITHIFVIMSFILLALTGMVLKFAHMEWANIIANIFGGIHAAGIIHRIGAIITFGYFIFHLFSLIRMKIKQHIPFKEFLFGSNSLMFSKQDIRDFLATIKWFFGKGPRPEYGRWTYWEKFDYMAVFWGVAVIGFSGLVLWFPEFFTQFFPGWVINVSLIIHSDEALLAVGFIFTIHFFNTHLRPEAFPMDTVMFTGHVPLEEYKDDRPREYKELEKSGKLHNVTTIKEFTGSFITLVKTFGYLFLFLGLFLVILIIYSLLS